ncbi:MAG: dihydrofolate reductase [Flavobacteriaceae bacterium]|nr:dihydrofolate reductase [Flavobacteriaceae bacterium]
MIRIVVAVSENNVIGKDNQLIWHIPRDLKHFKKLTLNHPMVMGRKTFESLGGVLPHRLHIVISTQEHTNTDRVIWVKSFEEAISEAQKHDSDFSIIGGGTIFPEALKWADTLEITRIHANFEGDTFFPEIPNNFECVSDERIKEENLDFAYSFRTYKRID